MRYVAQNTETHPPTLGMDLSDQRLLKQQLAREITSLEGQLYRLKTRQDAIDYQTLQTYEDMILSRKRLLDQLLWD
jgi:hypothetical protein